jgi:hydroxymethylbilane synthase
MWQTNWVVERLRQSRAPTVYRIEQIRTQGDRTQTSSVPLSQLGDKSMFVAELEQALMDGRVDVGVHPLQDRLLVEAENERPHPGIDLAVHSLKDLPGQLPDGLVIAAVTAREDARDVLVTRDGRRLVDLPPGSRVATGSLRRRAQLLHLRPDLRIEEIRGNVDTRIRKALAPDGPDGIVLAAAGVVRLGLTEHISEYFATNVLVPAVGQGALAVEVRSGDQALRRMLRGVADRATRQAILAERAVLRSLGGGCQLPLGAHATVQPDGATLQLVAIVATTDGSRLLRVERAGPISQPSRLGRRVAADLRAQGAGSILRAVLGER